MKKSKTLYQCPICKLHYSAKIWTKKCEVWCKKHPSCHLSIARHSVEAKNPKQTPIGTLKVSSYAQNKLFVLIPFIILLFVGTLALQKLGILSLLRLPFTQHVATGYITSGNYTDRMQAVFAEVNPKEGFQSKIVLGDIIPRLVSYGVIDMTKMQQLYQSRGGIPKEEMQILTKPSNTPLVINGTNSS